MQRLSTLLRTPMRRVLPVFARAQASQPQHTTQATEELETVVLDKTKLHYIDPDLPPYLRGSDYLLKIPTLTPEIKKELDKIESDKNYFNTPEWLSKIPARETADCIPPDTRQIYKARKDEFEKDPELMEFHLKSAEFHNRRDGLVSSLRDTGSVYRFLKNEPGFPQNLTEQDKQKLHQLDERLKLFYEEEINKTPPRNDYPEIPLETQQKYRLYAHYFMLSVVIFLPLYKFISYKREKAKKEKQ
eukprot:TRINITY_DN4216_c0_g1_i8.p1 TRINITY_DN4216_c0_g1~~TRINITY_DN4216_c0_g1_i8.p1  ORF type:complete len:245 (-),score=59.02 TRINITY_DN4216_c0_g1_i8:131-865(-)